MAATQNLTPKLAALVGHVVGYVAPQTVILFGSHARGTARPDSDFDLLVIADMSRGGGWWARSRRSPRARASALPT